MMPFPLSGITCGGIVLNGSLQNGARAGAGHGPRPESRVNTCCGMKLFLEVLGHGAEMNGPRHGNHQSPPAGAYVYHRVFLDFLRIGRGRMAVIQDPLIRCYEKNRRTNSMPHQSIAHKRLHTALGHSGANLSANRIHGFGAASAEPAILAYLCFSQGNPQRCQLIIHHVRPGIARIGSEGTAACQLLQGRGHLTRLRPVAIPGNFPELVSHAPEVFIHHPGSIAVTRDYELLPVVANEEQDGPFLAGDHDMVVTTCRNPCEIAHGTDQNSGQALAPEELLDPRELDHSLLLPFL